MSIAYKVLNIKTKQTLVCIMKNASDAETLRQELHFLFKGLDKNIVYFHDYEVGLTEALSPASTIISQRLKILNQLLHNQVNILITTSETLLTQLPPRSFIKAHVFQLKKNDQMNSIQLIQKLTEAGYERMNNITSHQQFSSRGNIIDFYPAYSKHPIRIELDDDIIDEIHYFDINTQRSLEDVVNSIDITPPYEFSPQGAIQTGWHRYLPDYHSSLDSLYDYINNALFVGEADLSTLIATTQKNFTVKEFCVEQKTIQSILKHSQPLTNTIETSQHIELSLDKKNIHQALDTLLKKKNILFVCQSYFRMNQLEALLLSHNISFTHVQHFYEFSSKKITIGITTGTLPHILHLDKAFIIPEQNVTQKTIVKESNIQPSLSSDVLNIGDLLIHTHHGIGRFIGIETHKINQFEQDFVVIEYANEDRLMFPPDHLNKIHPYHGTHQSVDTLQSSRWSKRKKKAVENIEQFSSKLLRLQSSEQKATVEPIPLPAEYDAFVRSFPFTETQDQLSIMEHIINDYQTTKLFNRLVCGDVGFGKTEIAMRSAFIALMNGYQVALITPTTILATQHYNNFKERFQQWSISIALVSRSNTFSKDDSQKIQNGNIQMVIGTHKLLSQQFSNLALVIIDEEHRFGVKQKDSVMAFNKAHKLSLTATPIPRSLNMALSKLRKISIMSNPPKSRLPIHTMIEIENDQTVKHALEREIHRGGQAYIIYNDVKNMDAFHKKLSNLMPHLSFGIVHGQMQASSIEKQMARFHSQGFQVLIASTIIESGLDIPNANTVIIYRSDKLGLAQLHQIRGRVGRSHHQAYAYLLTPDTLTEKASLRLNAIANAMRLGAGFQLSVADLEIRGAGNLLGEEQSGHVNAVGLSYYTHLLNQAVHKEHNFETEVDLEVLKIIPENYIPDTESRYIIYHKLANCHSEQALLDIGHELIDRYGKIPEPTHNLIQHTKLKINASLLKITSIKSLQNNIIIDIGNKSDIDTQHILSLIQTHPEYHLGGPTHLKITDIEHPIMAAQILINRLKLS